MHRYEIGQFVKVKGDMISSRHRERIGFVLDVRSWNRGAVQMEKYIVCFADQQEEFWGVQLEFPSFSIGDLVRVSPTLGSDCAAGMLGRVVAVEDRQANANHITEYAVEFNGAIRRQFLAFQLTPFSQAAQAKAS